MKKAGPPKEQAVRESRAGGDPEAIERQRVLGARLRSLFEEVVEEPVPDEFKALLDKLGDGPEKP